MSNNSSHRSFEEAASPSLPRHLDRQRNLNSIEKSRKTNPSVPIRAPAHARTNSGGPLSNACFAWLIARLLQGLHIDESLVRRLPEWQQCALSDLAAEPELKQEVLLDILASRSASESKQMHQLLKSVDAKGPDPSRPKTMVDVARVVGGVRWLWPGWLPEGLLTLVAADPGVGKSAFVLGSIVKAVIGQGRFLDGKSPSRTGPVIWCDTEAAHSGNVDRIQHWGLDPTRLMVTPEDPLDGMRITDHSCMERLREQVFMYDVPLIVIDSLKNAHDCDENSSAMGEVMQRLSQFAQSMNVTVLAIHHLKKRDIEENIDQNSVRGSTTIIAAARSVMLLQREAANSHNVVVKSGKCNFSLPPEPLCFAITGSGIVHRHSRPRLRGPRETAVKFLTELLADGPVRSKEVERRAVELGISMPTLQRAKPIANVEPVRYENEWYYFIEPERDETEDTQERENVDDLDDLALTLEQFNQTTEIALLPPREEEAVDTINAPPPQGSCEDGDCQELH